MERNFRMVVLFLLLLLLITSCQTFCKGKDPTIIQRTKTVEVTLPVYNCPTAPEISRPNLNAPIANTPLYQDSIISLDEYNVNTLIETIMRLKNYTLKLEAILKVYRDESNKNEIGSPTTKEIFTEEELK